MNSTIEKMGFSLLLFDILSVLSASLLGVVAIFVDFVVWEDGYFEKIVFPFLDNGVIVRCYSLVLFLTSVFIAIK